MAFCGTEFYKFAGELYDSHGKSTISDEKIVRTIISRAYYGAFIFARDKANITSRSRDVHQVTADFWRSKKESIANQLEDLKKLRHEADYDTTQQFAPRDAGKSLSLAKKIIEAIEPPSVN